MPCTEHDVGFTYSIGDCNDDATMREVTFTIRTGAASPDITYSLDFETDGSYDVVDVPLASGDTATETHWYPIGGPYSATLAVTYADGSDACTETRSFSIEGCCDVSLSATLLDCVGDTQFVELTVDNPGSFGIDYALDYETDGTTDAEGSLSAGGSTNHFNGYDASSATTYTATLTVSSPDGCAPYTASIPVEPCDTQEDAPCPEVEIVGAVGDCDEEGQRTYSVEASVRGEDGQSLEASLSFDSDEVDHQSGVGSLTLGGTITASGDTSLTRTLEILTPSDCGTRTETIVIPACEVCPEVAFGEPVWSDCNERGERMVTVEVTVTPASSDGISATLIVNGKKHDSGSGDTAFTLEGSAPHIKEGESATFTVEITEPDGCGAVEVSFVAPACEEEDGSGVGSGDCEQAGERCCLWCWLYALSFPLLAVAGGFTEYAVLLGFITIGLAAKLLAECNVCVWYCCTLKGLALAAIAVTAAGILSAGVSALYTILTLLVIYAVYQTLRAGFAESCRCRE